MDSDGDLYTMSGASVDADGNPIIPENGSLSKSSYNGTLEPVTGSGMDPQTQQIGRAHV